MPLSGPHRFQQRFLRRAARRRLPAKLPHDPIDDLLGDQAVGGQLAAGHVEPAGLGHGDLVGAGDVGRAAAAGGNQRPQPGPSADHVGRAQLGPGKASLAA